MGRNLSFNFVYKHDFILKLLILSGKISHFEPEFWGGKTWEYPLYSAYWLS